MLATKIVSRCPRTLWVKAVLWLVGASVKLQTEGPKSIRSGNGQPLVAPHCLLLVMVSTPLRVVNSCCSGFHVWRSNSWIVAVNGFVQKVYCVYFLLHPVYYIFLPNSWLHAWLREPDDSGESGNGQLSAVQLYAAGLWAHWRVHVTITWE